MKQITQLPIERYNDYMARGEAMLPIDVVENALISEMPTGSWFSKDGFVYMKTDLCIFNGVSVCGVAKSFDADDKGKLLTLVEVGWHIAYYAKATTEELCPPQK